MKKKFNYDFDIPEFSEDTLNKSFDFTFDDNSDIQTRFIKPPVYQSKTEFYKNAKLAASKIQIKKDCSYFGIISGNFIFGDLLEALMVTQQLGAIRLDISTLGMSQENVDSLGTLLKKGYIKELNLIVSDYFYIHERNGLIPYLLKELDYQNKFQLIVTGNHTKIIAAKLSNKINLVIHGSANLRSSGNIEQINIQDSKEILNFVFAMNDKMKEKYKIINKSIRGKKLWHTVTKEKEKAL